MTNRAAAAALALWLPVAAGAEEPLSVIDWLSVQPPARAALPEPPVSAGVERPEIAVAPLDGAERTVGLIGPAVTGLPTDLWRGSDPADLARQLRATGTGDNAALRRLLYALLLTEARPPAAASGEAALIAARLDRLMTLGAVDAAQALTEQAGPTERAERLAFYLDTTLLTGTEERGCAAVREAPGFAGYPARIYCAARMGDPAAGTVLYDSANALGLLDPAMAAALDRFLHPDLYEEADPLPQPEEPSPLLYRLYEGNGEPLPTAALPLPYAVADLRGLAGWKAELEAAERLARTGALPANRLLGIYTERQPAASGGVWDRVRAVRRLESALGSGSAEAVAGILPEAWEAMRAAGLGPAFAELYGPDLARRIAADAAPRALPARIALLSGAYEDAGRALSDHPDPALRFLGGLAGGAPDPALAEDPVHRAVAAGFAAEAVTPAAIRDAAASGRLGEAILRTIRLFDRGAAGNLDDLTSAIAALRALGLEETARRGALDHLILGPGTRP